MSRKLNTKDELLNRILVAEAFLSDLTKLVNGMKNPDYVDFKLQYEVGELGRGTFSRKVDLKLDSRK